MQLVKPMPFQEALDKIGERSPIGSKLSSSEWADVPVELRERAYFSSQIESARFLQRSRDAVTDFLAANRENTPGGPALKVGGRAQFIEMMRQLAMAEGLGPLTPDDRGGLKDITSERRLGLIFDVNTRSAADFGYRKQGLDPDVLNEFPAQRFIRVLGVKEPRDWHVQFDNNVYLKTDPIWKTINQDFGVPWGPWGWGCGHDVEDVDRDEAESLGLLKPTDRIIAKPEDFNTNLKASTKGLDPDLIAKLKAEFGNKVIIDGDTMTWAGAGMPLPAAPQPAAVPKQTPVPLAPPAAAAPAPKKASGAATAPVSDAIDVKVSGSLREAAKTALAAIDKVHDDGQLPDIFLRSTTRQDCRGYFQPQWDGADLTAEHIAVRANSPWPAFTSVHEVGHFLDLDAIGPKGGYGTLSSDPDMKRVLAAAMKTEAIKKLQALRASTYSEHTQGQMDYYLNPKEIWARSYAQFIAERSGNATLARDLEMALERDQQWTTEDFKGIATEIETMFKRMGWL